MAADGPNVGVYIKLRGGLELDWIGYTLILSSYKVGVSARRAEWRANWCRRFRESGGVNTSELEEGVVMRDVRLGSGWAGSACVAPLTCLAQTLDITAVI